MGVVCLGLGLWLVGIALAGTSDVFRVKTLIQGKIENTLAIQKVKITRDDLINLARDRNLGTAVPTNEVLALASQCDTNDDMKIIVFDTLTSSNLATIGQLDTVSEIFALNRKERIVQFTVPGTGGISNALTGGTLLMDATFDITTNNCVAKWSGTILGVLNTLVSGTNSIPIIGTNIVCCTTSITNGMTNTVCCTTNIMNGMTNIVGGTTNTMQIGSTNVFEPINIEVLIPKTTFTTQGKKIGTLIEEP